MIQIPTTSHHNNSQRFIKEFTKQQMMISISLVYHRPAKKLTKKKNKGKERDQPKESKLFDLQPTLQSAQIQ